MKLDSNTSEDDKIDEKELVNDDELDDIIDYVDSIEKEQCLLCGEFRKDGEIWYKCVRYGKWIHAECSEGNSAIDL